MEDDCVLQTTIFLQVVEAAAAQEYQLRLRDVAMVEEARKLGEKVDGEAAAAALRYGCGAPERGDSGAPSLFFGEERDRKRGSFQAARLSCS